VTGEHLKNVRIKFYKIDKTGTEMHYYSIDLQDAIIVDIKTWSPISFLPESAPYSFMEEVSFVYRKIVWTYEEGGIESEDSWKAPFTLSVQKTGIGTGTVTSDDGRINCGASCSGSYSAGTRVTLQAVPYTGSVFIGWTGAGCSGTGTCVIDLRTNTTVQAAFSLADPGCFTYDSDCDGDVDIVDVMLVASRWNTSLGDPNYDAKYDIDNDGDIDIVDVMLVAAQWGWKQ
jgi:hypothetical protein